MNVEKSLSKKQLMRWVISNIDLTNKIAMFVHFTLNYEQNEMTTKINAMVEASLNEEQKKFVQQTIQLIPMLIERNKNIANTFNNKICVSSKSKSELITTKKEIDNFLNIVGFIFDRIYSKEGQKKIIEELRAVKMERFTKELLQSLITEENLKKEEVKEEVKTEETPKKKKSKKIDEKD